MRVVTYRFLFLRIGIFFVCVRNILSLPSNISKIDTDIHRLIFYFTRRTYKSYIHFYEYISFFLSERMYDVGFYPLWHIIWLPFSGRIAYIVKTRSGSVSGFLPNSQLDPGTESKGSARRVFCLRSKLDTDLLVYQIQIRNQRRALRWIRIPNMIKESTVLSGGYIIWTLSSSKPDPDCYQI